MEILTQRLQITTKQHIYPRSGLSRFAGDNGLLQVLDLRTGVVKKLGPKAKLFVVRRGWDQRTESKTMNNIERQFGIVTKDVLCGAISQLHNDAHTVVSEMYSLWRIRCHRANNPLPNLRIGLKPERTVSHEAMDQGEHYGIITMAPGGLVPGRMVAGPLMQLALDRQAIAMAGKRWGVVRAKEGEFVLPDTFGDYMVLPLSPTCYLIADENDGTVGMQGVSHLNAVAKANATIYLAARDLTACPGI